MRFITEDTNKGDVKDPLSLNLYTYCQGNPIRYFDPSGHAPGDIFETMDEAAHDFASIYNRLGIIENTEYGSAIYTVVKEIIYHQIETGLDIKMVKTYYSYTVPFKGSEDGVIPNIFAQGDIVATIHSHGRYLPDYGTGNDEFSTKRFADTWWADLFNKTAYMVNPKGELLKYLPDSPNKKGVVIANDLYYDFNHPFWREYWKHIIKSIYIIPFPSRM